MSTNSLYLKNLLQILNENPDTWGTVLNVSGLQTLEDAIAGTGTVDVTSADAALDDTAGGPSELGPGSNPSQRFMIIDITGAPGTAKNVTVAPRSKVYLVANNTTGAQTITFKTTAGTGIAIPAGEAQWLWCDGTNILAASAAVATLATTATLAADSTLLAGTAATAFAQKAVANTFTAGQVTQRTVLVDAVGDLVPNLAVSNAFFHEMVQGENLAVPINATNGAQFSLVVEQGVGAPWSLTFQANTFLWDGGAPTLSTVAGDVDYFAFEYVTNVATTAKWIGSVIKGVA